MIHQKRFDLKRMCLEDKDDVLEKLAMLVFIRNEVTFKYQDILLDASIHPLIYDKSFSYENKSNHNIKNTIELLLRRTGYKTKSLIALHETDTNADRIMRAIETPWISFHLGSKTYTMHWRDIPDVYLIFKEFNYYKQSLSVIHEQLKGVLK